MRYEVYRQILEQVAQELRATRTLQVVRQQTRAIAFLTASQCLPSVAGYGCERGLARLCLARGHYLRTVEFQ